MQANLVVQEARLKVAAAELNSAQEKLDDKQRELDKVQALYDGAVREKQVIMTMWLLSRQLNWISDRRRGHWYMKSLIKAFPRSRSIKIHGRFE